MIRTEAESVASQGNDHLVFAILEFPLKAAAADLSRAISCVQCIFDGFEDLARICPANVDVVKDPAWRETQSSFLDVAKLAQGRIMIDFYDRQVVAVTT